MRLYRQGLVATAVLCCVGPAAAGEGAAESPSLDLRASPRIAFSPVEVMAVAELRGGHDVEELYCPGQVWDWGDGSRSARESDCAPFEPGTALERFFTARHLFRAPGMYSVRFMLVRADRTIAVATIPVNVYGHSGSASEH